MGTITDADLRLDLWNAELTGRVTTDKGTLDFHAFVHSEKDVLAIDVRPSAGERAFTLDFVPVPAVSPRIVRETRLPGSRPIPRGPRMPRVS